MPVNYKKDRAIRLMVDFLSHPENWGCEIKPVKSDAERRKSGLIFLGRAAMESISVGEACDHPSLGIVSVRWITGDIAGVVDRELREHTVSVGECRRIVKG
jgi:hypothetical protein